MKNRIVGGLGILFVAVPILLVGDVFFTVACALLCVGALKELMDLKEHHVSIPKIMTAFCLLNVCLFFFLQGKEAYPLLWNIQWITFTLLCLFFPCLIYKEKYSTHEALYLFASLLFLTLFFNSLLVIRFQNFWLLLYLLSVSMVTDIFAYLIGFFFGEHKCCPSISPNKTWEGCLGGIFMGSLLSSSFYFYKVGQESIVFILILSVLLSIGGLLGDLLFSKIKRENKIKDFSHLIPGHGGILDRLDSLIFIIFIYICFVGIR